MGKRFRCCPKKKDPCNYFHFLAGEERIKGRAMELLLVLKNKECKVVKERNNARKQCACVGKWKVDGGKWEVVARKCAIEGT
ncbi:hypothetical protein SLEP1_g16717 [Rubroshorea leprosula]|uniref:Uncharacterized protein n=1 Tax=Rubroshorea leprosula TaxID=152421 RepID=A0AAV5IRQ1_9ROSI|nr:hypothetical protein SLEP1_g16717 [Rubroshorea leprosula]